jgi:Protease inhibitor Inh
MFRGQSRIRKGIGNSRGVGYVGCIPRSCCGGLPMSGRARLFAAMATLGICITSASAQAPEPSEAARAMVGAWEISNAARDKTCPLTFAVEPAAEGGYRLELDPTCTATFPAMKQVAAWAMGPKDTVRLVDTRGAVILDFSEVETRMYEAERKGEGLYFMRTQAAIRAATVSPEQLFGDWALLKELEKPLCKVTLSNASAGGESYRIIVKAGCDASIAGFAPATWRLQNEELLLSGSTETWRFVESDASTWERVPPSTDPLVLMRQ